MTTDDAGSGNLQGPTIESPNTDPSDESTLATSTDRRSR